MQVSFLNLKNQKKSFYIFFALHVLHFLHYFLRFHIKLIHLNVIVKKKIHWQLVETYANQGNQGNLENSMDDYDAINRPK